MTIAQKITFIMDKKGLSQTELGMLLDISQRMVSYILGGKSTSRKVSAKIEKVYNDCLEIKRNNSTFDEGIESAKPSIMLSEKELKMHDLIIATQTEARIYREVLDTYFKKLDSTFDFMKQISMDYIAIKKAEHQEKHQEEQRDNQAAGERGRIRPLDCIFFSDTG